MAKKLIITADDFGVSDDINQGIIECRMNGSLTDMSILAAGEYFDDAVSRARQANISRCGIHLALTGRFRASAAVKPGSALADKDGLFTAEFPALILNMTAGRIGGEEVYQELRAQIQAVKRSGLVITHVDSHHHVHIFRPILKIVLKLMKEEGITYIRFPREKASLRAGIMEPVNALRAAALRAACMVSAPMLTRSGLGYNDNFIGHFHAHRLGAVDLFRAADSLPDGVTEIGCHPGFFGERIQKSRPWYRHCEDELKVLCDKRFMERIEENGIELVSW